MFDNTFRLQMPLEKRHINKTCTRLKLLFYGHHKLEFSKQAWQLVINLAFKFITCLCLYKKKGKSKRQINNQVNLINGK